MTVKEIRAMSSVELIANIFYMGIAMSNNKPIKKWDLELERYCKECERRGFVDDGAKLYEEVCR